MVPSLTLYYLVFELDTLSLLTLHYIVDDNKINGKGGRRVVPLTQYLRLRRCKARYVMYVMWPT